MASYLMEIIESDVRERNPKLDPSSEEYRTEVICLILKCAEAPNGSEETRIGLHAETGYPIEFIADVMTNLEASGSLAGGNLLAAIADSIDDEESGGCALLILVMAALGLANYHSNNQTWHLTEKGKREGAALVKQISREKR